jgi:hypothetical protein
MKADLIRESAYATMSMLLITFRVPGLGFIPATRNEAYIKQAFSALQQWRHVKFVDRALDRTAQQMHRANIDMDGLDNNPVVN